MIMDDLTYNIDNINPITKYLFDTFFSNKMKGFYIEDNVKEGLDSSICKFFEDYLIWSGINLEVDNYKQLIKNRLNCTNLKVKLTGELDPQLTNSTTKSLVTTYSNLITSLNITKVDLLALNCYDNVENILRSLGNQSKPLIICINNVTKGGIQETEQIIKEVGYYPKNTVDNCLISWKKN